MAILPLSSEQSAVLNACDAPMDDAFGDGVTGPTLPLPPYEKYKDLHATMKALVKNAFKSFFAATLQAMKNTPPTYVTPASFGAGWSNWGDGNYSAGIVRMYKDVTGHVQIQGLARSPVTPGAYTAILTLPAGYIPAGANALIFACVHNDGFCSVEVNPNGNVIFRGTPAADGWVSLSNIRFKAA